VRKENDCVRDAAAFRAPPTQPRAPPSKPNLSPNQPTPRLGSNDSAPRRYPIIGIFYIVLADEDSGVSAVGRSHDLLIGWTYVVGGAAMAVAMGAWAATLSPELLAATGGAGTTVLFDSLCACAPASFREDGRVRAMVASDFLFIMWAVLAGMCVVAPVLAVYAVLKPTAMNWCYAASIWVLTWGVAAFGRGHETDVPSKWCNPVACCCNDHEP
jgi:hypothetical protein